LPLPRQNKEFASINADVIPVGSAGSHIIEIVYDKDESVDFGSDDARVIELQATSEYGLVQFGGFETGELGSLPTGWSVGPHATDGRVWSVGHDLAPRVYAERVEPASEPTIDGEIRGEYTGHSRVALPDFGTQHEKPGELWLESLTNGKLFLALRVPQGSGGPGKLTLMVDGDRNKTLAGSSCGEYGTSPNVEDRRFELDFSAGLGTPTVQQKQGGCGTPDAWVTAPASDAWSVTAAAQQPTEDEGFVHVEVALTAPVAETPSELGVGVAWERGGIALQLPRAEGAAPDSSDAASWETIRYAPISEVSKLSLITVDGQPIPTGD
jgi:hypothetical protein